MNGPLSGAADDAWDRRMDTGDVEDFAWRVQAYHPGIEGLFAYVQRLKRQSDGGVTLALDFREQHRYV